MKKEDLKKLSNEELDKLLNEVEWCDRDILREHDERLFDGRIKLGEPIEDLEEHFRQRRERLREKEANQIKKAS